MKKENKICIPIIAPTTIEALKACNQLSNEIDLIEIWIDKILDEENISSLIKHCPYPVLAVCKTPKERGNFLGSTNERVNILISAAEAGASYVDIDIETSINEIDRLKKSIPQQCKLILSFHDFESTPAKNKLEILFKKAQEISPNSIIKIATFCNTIEDAIVLLELLKQYASSQKMIVLGMGEYGSITRILGPHLGSLINFCSKDKSSSTAPGQLTVNNLHRIEKLLKQQDSIVEYKI